ncbi:MAG: mechanosensitive ion channel family protein [Sulfolobales archaeon]
MPDGIAEILTNWLPVLYLAISLALIYLAYYTAKISLAKLRLRGIISRKFEETAKLIALAITAVIVLPAAISALVPHPLVPTVSLAVSLIVIAVVLFSIIGYVANSLSYLIVALTSTVRDGEYVRILVDGREYEGRVLLVEGNYMVLRTEPGASVMIPYSRLLRSVIIKLSQLPLVLRIKVVKPGGNIDEVVEKVANAVRKSRLVNKTSVSVKPIEASEDGVVLIAEAEAVNPRNINDCFEDLVKILMKELPYKVSIEVVSSRGIQTH